MSKYLELFKKWDSDTQQTKNSNILIIDGTNTFIRIFSNVPSFNDNGDHVGGVVGFLKSIGALIRQLQPTRCIIVFDGKGGSVRRRKIYPEYKNNRKIRTKLNRFDEFKDLIDEGESIKKQFNRLICYLDTLPVALISIDNIEADDTIAYLCNICNESNITISSTDKDFIQLVSDRITVWNPVKKIFYTPKKVIEEFGILPENFIIYKILDGDSSDNIPGIKGIGIKSMQKYFPALSERKLTTSDIIEISKEMILQNPKIKFFNNIVEGVDIIHRNNQLMQLEISDIPTHTKLNIQEKLHEEQTLSKKSFLELFFTDGLNTLIKDPHAWLTTTFNKLVLYAGNDK